MEIKQVQDIVSTLLYYAWAVDPTLAAALSSIASQQASATKKMEEWHWHQKPNLQPSSTTPEKSPPPCDTGGDGTPTASYPPHNQQQR
eukprot:5613677-Ditylum_brightwellii.AAC.1